MAKVDGGSFKVGEEIFGYFALDSELPELPNLTPAEREVVQLVCEGCVNKEIAQKRNTSTNTVGNQLASIFVKLGVSSRFELVELVARSAAGEAEQG